MARTLLVATSNLELLKEEIETTEELGMEVDPNQKFQHCLVHSAVHGLYSVYWSLKYHCYNSGYRDIRYLFETYLILRGLNQRMDEAGAIWKTHEIEAETLVGGIEENPTFDFESVEELASICDSEMDKLYDKYPSFRDAQNYMSERAAHPLRIDGSYLEGVEVGGQKFEQLYISLALLYGIAKEYVLTFEETAIQERISDHVDQIEDQVLAEMPTEVPAFLEPYL